MVILIHGDNIPASRKKIDEFIQKDGMVIRKIVPSDNLYSIREAIETKDLFSEKKILIIEKFLEFNNEQKDEFFNVVNKNCNFPYIDIILWEDEKIEEKFLEKIKTKEIFFFDFPKYHYKFLDALYPQNKKILKHLFDNVIKSSSEELMFYSMVKRIRMLLIIKTGRQQEFEETKRLSGWQTGKLNQQAKLWKQEQLINFYKKLFQIELGMKTSQLPLTIAKHIDFLLLSL